MTRRLTALLAGLDALLVFAIGVAIPLVPLTIVWAAHFGFQPEWPVFWRAAVDTWLLGHGVDVTFTLDPDLAAGLGLSAAGDPIKVTIALLGFALLTLLLAVRAGRRIAEAGHPVVGAVSAVVVFAAASLGAAVTAVHPAARPSLVQAVLLPGLVFAVGVGVGLLRARHGSERDRLREWLDERPVALRAGVSGALRAGIGAVALTLAVSAVLVALLFVLHFADLIGIYEALHTEVVGGVSPPGNSPCCRTSSCGRHPGSWDRASRSASGRTCRRSARLWARSRRFPCSARCRRVSRRSGSPGCWCPSWRPSSSGSRHDLG